MAAECCTQLVAAAGPERRQEVWQEVADAARVNWDWKDRDTATDLANSLASRLHYYPVEQLLAGPALMEEYSGEAWLPCH